MKDSGRFSVKRLLSAFKYAFQGIQYATQSEKNFRIHIVIGTIVIITSMVLRLNSIEWIFILMSIFGVMALELVNSALERAVDLATKEIHPLAKQAKDLAAAAVLVYAFLAIVIGFIIFIPKLLNMWNLYP